MDFIELAKSRQSCRSYDAGREVEEEKIDKILEVGRLSPSACNGQPYRFTVCRGESALAVFDAVSGMGMNKFAKEAPVMIVISEGEYVKSAAIGAKLKKNDYRSIDIGIAAAYMTAEAESLGLGSCILGWLDDEKIRKICGLSSPVRLVITVGYVKADDKLREKRRKSSEELITKIYD
jgi:nitroreductase